MVLMKPPRSSFFARKGAIFDMMTAVAGVVPLDTEEARMAHLVKFKKIKPIEDTTNTATTRSLCLAV